MSSSPGQSELLLLAFRYISGEVGADEGAAFEGRLESEPAAQQAVIDAVRLTAALQRNAPEPLPALPGPEPLPATGRREFAERRGWAAVVLVAGAALAAAVLVALEAGRPDSRPDHLSATAEEAADPDAGTTVSLWSALDADENVEPVPGDGALPDGDFDPAPADVIPDWMLSALNDRTAQPADPATDGPGRQPEDLDGET